MLVMLLIILFLVMGNFLLWNKKEEADATPNTTTPPTSTDANIKVTLPEPYTAVSSPIAIAGEATGNWYFEATFPVSLVDAEGKVLVQTFAEAKGEWMTTDYVPFTLSIPFSVSATTSATLVFERDNPSGLPEHDRRHTIPVTLMPVAVAERDIALYYYNEKKDSDVLGNILCSKKGITQVTRSIAVTKTPIQDTIKLLLEGNITAAEKEAGITTEYPLSGFALTGASEKDGALTLSFVDPNNKTSGGSCRATILWAQIEATAKQFPGIKSVRFIPDTLFQP